MNILALSGATVGAVIGAAIWAGISYFTGYEVGYVAWGVGGLVGFGAHLGGGRGAATGALCAVLALLSIFAGKYYSVSFYLKAEVRAFADEMLTEEAYQEMKKDAAAFLQIASEEEYPAFMVAYGYTEAESAEDIETEELEYFKTETVEELRQFDSKYPAYSVWKALQQREMNREVQKQSVLTEAVIDNLGLIDILFAFLGIATAFKVGAGVETAEA